jgi:hypothetical protein
MEVAVLSVPLVILNAISTAKSVSELLDVLLKLLNLQSKDVERLERKWDIKQHADFQSAVQLLRLSHIEASDIKVVDIDLLKKGLADLLKSWNYYTDLYRKGILDKTAELELVYIISGWLIARCYLKIQEYEGRQELIEDAVRYYLRVMEFVRGRIDFLKSPPPPQPILLFHTIDTAILSFISSGNSFVRLVKLFILFGAFFISLPYVTLDILVRLFGYAICGKPRINSAIVEKLNEMYFKSLVEVSPYINQQVVQSVLSQSSASGNSFG